mgnify:CR=1 FL=1
MAPPHWLHTPHTAQVESDPLHLWVAPSSPAAQDKAAFEASFGPFSRIEQIILATPVHAGASGTRRVSSPIVSEAAIELAFDMYDAVAALRGETGYEQ